MQDILDYADDLGKWKAAANDKGTLEELSILARATMECPTASERASSKGILLQRAEVVGCRRELGGVFRALESDRAQDRLRQSCLEE